MDEVKKYWRDKVMQLLSWGTAALIAVAGWSIKESQKFEIGPLAGQKEDLGNVIRAIALLLFAVVFSLAWFSAVRWIYTRHLSQDTDATVLPWKSVRNYVIFIVCILLLVSCLVTFG